MSETPSHEGYEAPVDLQALGWVAPEPPAGFAADLVDLFAATPTSPERQHSRRRRTFTVAALAIAAAAVLWLLWPAAGVIQRDGLSTDVLRTIAIADRAIAVAQPGTDMRWQVEKNGAARIEQDTGRVFYRVDHGAPFSVATPAGTVVVTGTCFEVELTPVMRQSLKSASLGAALASAVVVTVYEGRVVLANDRGDVAIEAGQRASAQADRAPRHRSGDDDPDDTAVGSGGLAEVSASDAIVTVRRQARDLEKMREANRTMADEVEALRKQVESLGGRVGQRGPAAAKARAERCARNHGDADCSFANPDQDTLVEMARCATLKIDHPSFLDAMDPPDGILYAKEMGITDPAEQQAIQAAAEKHHREFYEGMRKLFVEVGGDRELAERSSAEALQAFIRDQVGPELLTDVQRRLAEERAGLREPPANVASLPPEERFWRLRAEMGNDFEAHVAQALGPERAAQLRQAHDGWQGSRSIHSADCNDEATPGD